MSRHQKHPLSTEELEARRANALLSTGPRTERGKTCSKLNALKHGRYSARFEASLQQLGEDPEEYQRFHDEQLEAWEPANAVERRLAEEIVDNWWELDRSRRARMGMLCREREEMEIEHLEAFHAMLRSSYDAGADELKERGLRFAPDCPAKFRQVSAMLGEMLGAVERKDFGSDWEASIRTLYGEKPNSRGSLIQNAFFILGRRPEGTEPDPDSVALLRRVLLEEDRDVLGEFMVYKRRYLEVTPAMQDARMAPAEQRWTWILRAERLLELTLDRKIRLLMTMQNERRKREAGNRSRDGGAHPASASGVSGRPGRQVPQKPARPRGPPRKWGSNTHKRRRFEGRFRVHVAGRRAPGLRQPATKRTSHRQASRASGIFKK